ncbi:MAG: hypothetical protein ACTHJQ_25445, partial [Rhizobiaceae bacterium]
MATEFNDAQHWGIFTTGQTLTSQTGKMVRQSELTLAALRAAGVLDIMEDGTTAPAHDRFWLDKTSDPAVLKEWDSVGSTWQPMTFDRLFGRATVTDLVNIAGTANAITCDEPSPFMDGKIYGLVPTLSNTGATTIQVAGVGTYDVVYPDGSDIAAGELSADLRTPLLFANGRFEVLFGSNAGSIKRSEVDASTFGFVLDEDDMASDSATKVPTQQSVKAYVDALVLPAIVSDRTALKAVDTTKYSASILTEGSSVKRGRFGTFLLGNYSDYSAAVTADTAEGFVIRSTSDPTKVWIRDAPEACPEHFGAVADGATDDYTAISVGIAVADALAIPFKFYGSYAMGSSLTIPVTLRNIDSAPESKITGINSVVNGVSVGGAPTRFGKIVLPSIFSFSGIGLTAIGGIMDLYVPEIVSCGTGVRVADGGGGATVRANFIGNCTLAIEFYMSSTSAVIQGSSVRGGFITNTPNIVKFSGAAGACDGLIVEYDAIDVVTGGGVVFNNSLSVAVPRFTFKCPSWLGGNGFSAATKTQLFSGQWNNGDFDITNALAFDQSHMTPGQPAATRWKFRNQGSSGGFALAGSLAAFNGGLMLCQTEFMVKYTLAADLAAGSAVTARFYHILADSNYYNWQMTKCAGTAGSIIRAYSYFNSTDAGLFDIT